MGIRKNTPCDFGECPYCAEYQHSCEYWCGEEEPRPEEEYNEYEYDVD